MSDAPRLTRRNYGRNHAYYLDGEKVPGVTTLIKDGNPAPALVDWAAKTVAACAVDGWDDLGAMTPTKRYEHLKTAHNRDRDQAGNRGTQVHRLAEQMVAGAEVEVPDLLAGHVESYVRFLDEWEPEPIGVEVSVANTEWRYGGTLDLIAQLPDGRRLILDLKTNRSGIFGEVALQTCLYARCNLAIMDGVETDFAALDFDRSTALAVWVRADGYDVYPLDIGERTWKAARHVVSTALARNRSHKFSDFVGEALGAPTPNAHRENAA